MIREMRIRNYSPRTINTYVSLINHLAQYFKSSPDQINIDQIKDYLHYKIQNQSCSISAVDQTISALKILYQDVLGMKWEDLKIKRPRKQKKLPVILSRQEGAGGVIKYLGHYAHRVAICKDRILSIEDHNIRFRWKDYKASGSSKIINLDASEFIRRFIQHILPNGFYKIRYYGMLASVNAKTKRVLLFQLLDVVADKSIFDGLKAMEVLQIVTGINPQLCPIRRKGIMKPLSCLLPKGNTPFSLYKQYVHEGGISSPLIIHWPAKN
jgi:hypothetical protein